MAHYHALCASLPMLKIDDAPVLSSEAFLSSCSAFVKPDKLRQLEAATLSPAEKPDPKEM